MVTLLITYITEIRRTFCTLKKFITWIKFITRCDVACLVYVKLKWIGTMLTLLQQNWNSVVPLSRAELNEREVPGKVVTTRPPKRLTHLRSVSHALVSTLQKYLSKTSKHIIRQPTLQRQLRVTTYGGSHVVSLFKQKVVSQKTIFLLLWHYTTIFGHRLSDHLHCTNRPFTYVLRKDMSILCRRSKITPFKN